MEKIEASKTKLLHLQGIRGLAIIAVTLFHFYPDHFSHGYLGVDIFFALSGYLMTMMLSRSAQLGPADVLDFFYRRVKRIVPLYYLITLFILGGLYFAPLSIQVDNQDSAWNSLLFITNLIQPENSRGYFNKLGAGVDMFTHTWSLSLEMQFYLIFPLIFIIYSRFSEGNGKIFLGTTSFLSFSFYYFSNEFISFNSVFSRIWQFNAGMLIYTVTTSTAQYSIVPSELELQPHCLVPRKKMDLSTLYTFVTLVGLMLVSQNMYAHISRILAIILTLQLFQYADGSFLENRILVEIGEISYAWYLVHWPFAAICKLLNIVNPVYLFAIFMLTFSLSALLHYTFEQFYLKWDKKTIGAFVFILVGANTFLCASMKPSVAPVFSIDGHVTMNASKVMNSFLYPSDFINWNPDYVNMTNEQLVMLNEGFQATEVDKTLLKNICKGFIKTNYSNEIRCRFEEGLKKDSPMHLLVIGNSYSGNLLPVIHDECKGNFSRIEISYLVGCEALTHTNLPIGDVFNCTQDIAMVEAVREINPDVLFIVERHFDLLKIINGTNPFDDNVFKIASERLTEIQKHVKRRIFILDDFPEKDAMTMVIDKLKGKIAEIDDNQLNAQTFENTIARMRIARLVSECPKCKSFDFTSQFFFNGQFRFYDPKYFISFTGRYRHLTAAGHERVRPLVRHLCHTS